MLLWPIRRSKRRWSILARRRLQTHPPGSVGFIAEYTDKWAKVIRAANIKPE
jgi:hypothetical protein